MAWFLQKAGDQVGTELEKRVEELCLEEGITIQKVRNEMAEFQLNLQFPNPQSNINIFQPKGKEDTIVIGAVIEVSETHKQGLRALNTKKRESFIWDLRLMLARGRVEFEMRHPDNILEHVRVHTFLFKDGFSKQAFMNALLDVNRAKLLVIWFIQREFGVSPPSPVPSVNEGTSMYR